MTLKRILIYETASGREPYSEFVASLPDRRTVARIDERVRRAGAGNLGYHWSVGGGVIELRLHFGPGYRVYVGLEGEELIVLLCGGDKASQSEDIRRAIKYWHEFRRLQ